MTFQHHLQVRHNMSTNKDSHEHVHCQGVSWQGRKADALHAEENEERVVWLQIQ